MNNEIRMNQDEFQNAFKAFEQVINKLDQTTQGITSSFSPAVSSGLIKNLGQLTNQMGSIGSSISGMNQTMQKQSNEMFEYDRAMAKEAEAIEIPTDFLNENSTKVNTFNQALVDKMDGKSVNLGQGAKTTEIDEAVVLETQTKEGLFDLSGAATKEEEYVRKQGTQGALGSITKDSDLSEKDYREKQGTKEGSLQNITGNQALEDNKFKESTVQRKEMGSIAKDSDNTQKELDEVVNIRSQQMQETKKSDSTVDAQVSGPSFSQAQFGGLQRGQSASYGTSLPSTSSSVSPMAEQREKENMLSQVLLEEERRKQLLKKEEEDTLEKVDYNDFNQ